MVKFLVNGIVNIQKYSCILFGLPLIGGIAGLIRMKFYKLDVDMKKVRETIERTKSETSNN